MENTQYFVLMAFEFRVYNNNYYYYYNKFIVFTQNEYRTQ